MKKNLVDILIVVEAIVSYHRFGNLCSPSWLPHWYGCQLADYKYYNAADYEAAIELISEELDVSTEEADKIARAFAHGDYGI